MFAGPFLQGSLIGLDGLLQVFQVTITLGKSPKCITEIILGRRPVERDAFAGPFPLVAQGDGLEARRAGRASLCSGHLSRHSTPGQRAHDILQVADRAGQAVDPG